MIQLRAEDPSGSLHTTWCDHRHKNRKSALEECKSFFLADNGYKNHLVMTPVDLACELEREEPPFGNPSSGSKAEPETQIGRKSRN
jgi:hypothetical protein